MSMGGMSGCGYGWGHTMIRFIQHQYTDLGYGAKVNEHLFGGLRDVPLVYRPFERPLYPTEQ